MADFVLIHGAWHGGWCWARVRSRLEARGHRVFTPTLTGLGERSHLMPADIGLETHIRDVTAVLAWEGLTEVVLCGHSYGGWVAGGVIQASAERIAAVAYLDAFLPRHGVSLHDTYPPGLREAQTALVTDGDGWRLPPMTAASLGVNLADQPWVDRLCTPHPIGTYRSPLSFEAGHERIAHCRYLFASGWGSDLFAEHRDQARAWGWPVAEVPSGHDVMVDQPEAVVEELVAALHAVRRAPDGALAPDESGLTPPPL